MAQFTCFGFPTGVIYDGDYFSVVIYNLGIILNRKTIDYINIDLEKIESGVDSSMIYFDNNTSICYVNSIDCLLSFD